jgi:dynein heavy chain
VEKVSKVARTMCLWVIAVHKYALVYKAIEPKIKKRDTMEKELREW